MDGLGSPELIFIVIIALFLLGPNEVRRMAYKFGRFMREVQRMSHEFMTELNRESDAEDERERTEKLEKARALAAASLPAVNVDVALRGYHPAEAEPEATAKLTAALEGSGNAACEAAHEGGVECATVEPAEAEPAMAGVAAEEISKSGNGVAQNRIHP